MILNESVNFYVDCIVQTMYWNIRLFILLWPAMYMYFYTTQRTDFLRVKASQPLVIKER